MDTENLRIRKPVADDGVVIHQLIQSCPPLDVNSTYLYLLQCTHFAETCVVAELNGKVAAFLSGYIKPGNSSTFFLWQVAVGESLRGKGMARRLLDAVLEREACHDVCFLETTITPDNQASWALFRSFARDRQAELTDQVLFSTAELGGQHEPEVLVRIGPFQNKPFA
ncbi:diaminobutyrate acetyltransferase [Marinospirillum alkaliphilum]|uniref:L-2,4-diaminobutyric acid acetyltransferase n=1 Tax=Marinospirillum alkaliphilum DSM 21637 TaxID=1122209 RepID=A0A1K1XMJ2_9GAMM|nr:diaminobutyrate acetyltransferase [Marinospirillum alkaliphilum]SFX50276.1 L-2,4-diaminobutyric acid acetyltransferase [Marinospirillum alkaliphilum DSM 21637]